MSRLCEPSKDLKGLKANILEEIGNNTPPYTLAKVMTNTKKRLSQCADDVGRYYLILFSKLTEAAS